MGYLLKSVDCKIRNNKDDEVNKMNILIELAIKHAVQ